VKNILPLLLCTALPALAAPPAAPLIDAIGHRLHVSYVFPEQADKAHKALQAQLLRGAYQQQGPQLAEALTSHLRGALGDKHLWVRYSNAVLPKQEDAAPAQDIARMEAEESAQMQHINYGIVRTERLPGNIGYLELHGFAPAALSGNTIAAAMTLLNNTSALIIDLRNNRGGDPDTVALLAGYFFNERTRLNDIYWRDGDFTSQQWSAAHVSGPRYGAGKEVLILTANKTFSAAEDFSYAMKNLKRATIVGETTGGGAHPGRMYRLDDHYEIFVPNGRSISTITKTDWEGTGVTPDLATPEQQALSAALGAIRRNAWLRQPVYVRGSFNAWNTNHRLCSSGPASYSVQLALSKGHHEFRVASEDTRSVEYGAVPGPQNSMAGIALLEGGDNLQLDAPEDGSYLFDVDLSKPETPVLRYSRLEKAGAGAGCSPAAS
jgi:retinol-binding protein 3